MQNQAIQKPQFYPIRMRPAAAARYLGISPRYLAQLRASGRLPFVRLGRRCVLFERADLDRFLSAHRVDPNAVTAEG